MRSPCCRRCIITKILLPPFSCKIPRFLSGCVFLLHSPRVDKISDQRAVPLLLLLWPDCCAALCRSSLRLLAWPPRCPVPRCVLPRSLGNSAAACCNSPGLEWGRDPHKAEGTNPQQTGDSNQRSWIPQRTSNEPTPTTHCQSSARTVLCDRPHSQPRSPNVSPEVFPRGRQRCSSLRRSATRAGRLGRRGETTETRATLPGPFRSGHAGRHFWIDAVLPARYCQGQGNYRHSGDRGGAAQGQSRRGRGRAALRVSDSGSDPGHVGLGSHAGLCVLPPLC